MQREEKLLLLLHGMRNFDDLKGGSTKVDLFVVLKLAHFYMFYLKFN